MNERNNSEVYSHPPAEKVRKKLTDHDRASDYTSCKKSYLLPEINSIPSTGKRTYLKAPPRIKYTHEKVISNQPYVSSMGIAIAKSLPKSQTPGKNMGMVNKKLAHSHKLSTGSSRGKLLTSISMKKMCCVRIPHRAKPGQKATVKCPNGKSYVITLPNILIEGSKYMLIIQPDLNNSFDKRTLQEKNSIQTGAMIKSKEMLRMRMSRKGYKHQKHKEKLTHVSGMPSTKVKKLSTGVIGKSTSIMNERGPSVMSTTRVKNQSKKGRSKGDNNEGNEWDNYTLADLKRIHSQKKRKKSEIENVRCMASKKVQKSSIQTCEKSDCVKTEKISIGRPNKVKNGSKRRKSKEGKSPYSGKKSRVGELYQAVLPDAGVWEVESGLVKENTYEQIWDKDHGHLAKDCGEDHETLLDSMPFSQKYLGMAAIHSCNYNRTKAHQKLVSDTRNKVVHHPPMIHAFHTSVLSHGKHFQSIAAELNSTVEECLILYYNHYKLQPEYHQLKQQCRNENLKMSCEICKEHGQLLCCNGCPRVFHTRCIEPSMNKVPVGDWYCPMCANDSKKETKDGCKKRNIITEKNRDCENMRVVITDKKGPSMMRKQEFEKKIDAPVTVKIGCFQETSDGRKSLHKKLSKQTGLSKIKNMHTEKILISEEKNTIKSTKKSKPGKISTSTIHGSKIDEELLKVTGALYDKSMVVLSGKSNCEDLLQPNQIPSNGIHRDIIVPKKKHRNEVKTRKRRLIFSV